MNTLSLKKGFTFLLSMGTAGLLLSACQYGGATPAAPTSTTQNSAINQQATTTSVSIQNMTFAPQNLQVKVGQTVTWTNQDQVAHTVTSDTGAFDSGTVANGNTYSFTFTKAGTFAYHCAIHPSMKGQVTVMQ